MLNEYCAAARTMDDECVRLGGWADVVVRAAGEAGVLSCHAEYLQGTVTVQGQQGVILHLSQGLSGGSYLTG